MTRCWAPGSRKPSGGGSGLLRVDTTSRSLPDHCASGRRGPRVEVEPRAGGWVVSSVEEVVEERTLAALAVALAVPTTGAVALAVPTTGAVALAIATTRAVVAVGGRWRLVAATPRRWWRGLTAMPPVLGVHQAFELAAVEEDSPAVGALVDGDAASFVPSHGPMALRTDEIAHL
jgi:hypothetical protein